MKYIPEEEGGKKVPKKRLEDEFENNNKDDSPWTKDDSCRVAAPNNEEAI